MNGSDETTLGEEYQHDDPSTVQIEVWARVLDKDGAQTGRCRWVRNRTIVDVYRDLVTRLGDMVDEYFHPSAAQYAPGFKTEQWPRNVRWIACYAVTGGSEGHYVHVDCLVQEGEGRDSKLVVRHMFLGKTFQGMAHAQAIAARCAELLGA